MRLRPDASFDKTKKKKEKLAAAVNACFQGLRMSSSIIIILSTAYSSSDNIVCCSLMVADAYGAVTFTVSVFQGS